MVAQLRSRCYARLAELMVSAAGALSLLPCPFFAAIPLPPGLSHPWAVQPGVPSRQSRGSPSKKRRDAARASARQRFFGSQDARPECLSNPSWTGGRRFSGGSGTFAGDKRQLFLMFFP